MLNRRDALKLGTGALLLPISGMPITSENLAAMELSANYPVGKGNPARTGELPGPAPSLDEAIIVRWKFAAYGSSTDVSFDSWTTPAVAEGVVFAGGRDNHTLLALDSLTGTSRWQYPMENDLNFPTVAGDMVYCRSLNSAVHAIDKNSGEKRWEFRSSGPLQGQVVSDGVVYIANNETQLVALDALTGSELWRTDGIRTLPTVVNGIAYVTDVDDALCALDPDSGNLLNKARFDIPLSWRTYVNGVIYGLDRDGNLIAAENAESPTLLSDVVVRGAPSHSGIERGTANAGEGIGRVGAQDVRSGQTWVDVTINGVTGWIPLDAIDSSTLPAEDGLRYVFRPEGDH